MMTKADCIDGAAEALKIALERSERGLKADAWLAIAQGWTVLANATPR